MSDFFFTLALKLKFLFFIFKNFELFIYFYYTYKVVPANKNSIKVVPDQEKIENP